MYASYPKKRRPRPEAPINKSRISGSAREFIGLIGAGTGIFVALLYLAGRSFASGYFSAMNIPSYQVNFSLWEYGEVAWLPMIVYPTAILGLDGLIWGVVLTILDLWILPLFRRFIGWVKSKIKFASWQLPEISRDAKRWFALVPLAVVILLSISFIGITLQSVSRYGASLGQTDVLENAPQVELVSPRPMTLDDGRIIGSQVGNQQTQDYEYKGYHLLTFNGGKYYLFKDIDPISCKPRQVFVINDDKSMQVRLLPAVSLDSQCKKDLAK